MTCCYCSLPLEGVQVGAGDGTGQEFAHPGCYANARLQIALEAVQDARNGGRSAATAFDTVEREITGISHVLAVAL